jgi:hypothetical protein
MVQINLVSTPLFRISANRPTPTKNVKIKLMKNQGRSRKRKNPKILEKED